MSHHSTLGLFEKKESTELTLCWVLLEICAVIGSFELDFESKLAANYKIKEKQIGWQIQWMPKLCPI